MRIILVLDDQISMKKSDDFRAGRLPAGRISSENAAENLLRAGFDVMVYDGRGSDGRVEFVDDPSSAATELTARINRRYRPVGNEPPVECDVLLDLKWFDDEDYGRRLLDALFTRTESMDIRLVIVWSNYTDPAVRNRFRSQFEIPPGNVLDRAANDPNGTLLVERFSAGQPRVPAKIVRCSEGTETRIHGSVIGIGNASKGPFKDRFGEDKEGVRFPVSVNGGLVMNVGLESLIELPDSNWEVITVSHAAPSLGVLELREVDRRT
jgi:hypothetical protein